MKYLKNKFVTIYDFKPSFVENFNKISANSEIVSTKVVLINWWCLENFSNTSTSLSKVTRVKANFSGSGRPTSSNIRCQNSRRGKKNHL